MQRKGHENFAMRPARRLESANSLSHPYDRRDSAGIATSLIPRSGTWKL